MAVQTLSYFPTPKEPNTTLSVGTLNPLALLVSSLALGMLCYDSFKTFLVISAGVVIYQIFRFNQIVHSADSSKHQYIRSWAIHACTVMLSIGIVFFGGSLSNCWSSYLALRNLQLIPCISHLVTGILMGTMAYYFGKFYPTLVQLSQSRQWVAMEDYVENYPLFLKQGIFSDYLLNTWFFIAALLAQTTWGLQLASYYLLFNQFSAEQEIVQNLHAYFENPDLMKIPEEVFAFSKWLMAVHQFQRLEIEDQLRLGPPLQRIASSSTPEQQDQLPNEVKACILYAELKEIKSIPFLPEEQGFKDWQVWAKKFEALDQKWQTAFGDALYDLLRSHGDSAFSLPDVVILSALKAQFRNMTVSKKQMHDESIDWAERLFISLIPEQKTEFGIYLKNLIDLGLSPEILSPGLKALVQPDTTS